MFDGLFEKIRNRDLLESKLLSIKETKSMTWEQIATALYDILDDIDTADDICKEDSKAFQKMVMKLQAKKNEYFRSPDGYGLEPVVSIKEDMTAFAKKELELVGLFDKDSDYDGMLGEAVLELIQKFASQGHSGCSAAMTMAIFDKLANYKPLSEITDDLDEWRDISEFQGGKAGWQSTRSPSCFSEDGGKTYWDIDEDYFFHEDEDGTRWSGGLSEDEWDNRPMHQSKHTEKKE